MSVSVTAAARAFVVPALIVVVALFGFFSGNWLHARYFINDTPVQPIEFSHRLHVETYEIPCLHCHVSAEHTPVAGVPPLSRCMACHQVIARDRPEIVRLIDYWEAQQPVPWVQVYHVPDFVHFTHRRHVQADVACQDCHGPVETMDRVTRVNQPTMMWCVECHTAHEVERGLDCWTCHK